MHRKVEAIMAENDERIKHYPDIFFDPLASIEIRRFVGALSQFLDKFEIVVRSVYCGTTEGKEVAIILGP
eukprot:UN02156